MNVAHLFGGRTPFALALTLALGGCAVGPDYQRPAVELPSEFAEAATLETADAAITARWWTLYNDPVLDRLVATALQNNRDVQRAIAQIEEAEAVLDETDSSLFPTVDLGASSSRSRSSTLNAQPLPPGTPTISTSHRLALSTSFELDFWGKLRRATEAARAQVLGSRYGRDTVALTLAGATTQAYFALRSLDAQIAVSRSTLGSREEALAVIRSRVEGGLSNTLELNQAEAARADAALQLLDMQRQRALVEHQLALLTAEPGLRIEAGSVMELPLAALPPVGLPSTLVERRPDVRQAEQALVAANARIGVAEAARLPTFSLTGAFGGQSAELGDVLKAGARIWSLGLDATVPLFDAGRNNARIRQSEARREQVLADYRRAVETAFKEVADALTNAQQTAAAVADIVIKVDAARNALRLSRLRYDAGYGPYLDVLDAQRTLNAAELALVQNRQAQLAYSVDLMKALGGGWSADANAPLARSAD